MSRRLIAIDQLQQFTAVELLSDPGHDPNKQPIPQCMEVRLDYGLPDGKVAHNVLHGRYGGTFQGTPAMANALKTAFAGNFTSSGLAPLISSNVMLNAVALRDLNALNTLYIMSTSAAQAIGSSASQPLPLEVSAALTCRTAISGPGGRGRIYLTGFTTDGLATGNVMSGALFTAMGAWGNLVASTLSAQSLTHCLALPSRIQYTGSTGRIHPARPAQTADVLQTICRDNHWDSQRRRGLK